MSGGKIMKARKFDIVNYLDSEEAIQEYINQILEEGNTEELSMALNDVIRASGISQIAEKTGLGRESLYKTFSPGAQPRFDTVMKILHALNLDLKVSAHVSTH